MDVFISAAKKQMDALEAKGLLLPQTRKNLLQNQVVLIAPSNSNIVTGFNSLADSKVTPVALGEPKGVPAGQYAQEILQSLKLWEQVAPKAVYAKDVRQVLSYVETENAAAGLVYLTDTKKAKGVKVVAIAPKKTHSPVLYPLAILKNSQQPRAAQAFINYLNSPKALKVFQDAGFTTLAK